MTRILIAGVGNIFLGDDGFGVEVATRLQREEMPAGVEVADFGIRGLHLAYQLLDGYDVLVLVDALGRGKPPGTVTVLQPAMDSSTGSVLDAHGMAPDEVVALVGSLAGQTGSAAPGQILVVGCEPESCAEGIGLSAVVEAAVQPAVATIVQLVNQSIKKGSGGGVSNIPCDSAARSGGGGGRIPAGYRPVFEDPGHVSRFR